MKIKKPTERQLAQQVIKNLETYPHSFSGICVALINETVDLDDPNLIGKYLPKLHKYLSNRINYHYNFNDVVGRRKGINSRYFLWKPFNSKPRIAVLKKVYNIK